MKKITLEKNDVISHVSAEDRVYSFFKKYPANKYKRGYIKKLWSIFKTNNITKFGVFYTKECDEISKLYLKQYNGKVSKAPVMTKNEQLKKLDEMKNDIRSQAMFAFLFGFGLRSAELINIRKQDINVHGSSEQGYKLSLNIYVSKTGEGMAICEESIYSDIILHYIKDMKSEQLVFARKCDGKKGTVDIVRTAMKKYGVNKTHSGRRSLATLGIISGDSLELVRAKLRHTSLTTTREYLSVDNKTILKQRMNM